MIETRSASVLLVLVALGACDTAKSKPTASEPPPATTTAPTAVRDLVPPPPDVAAPPADAVRTPSGLASKVLTPGNGTDHPRPQDQVKLTYTGWTKSGISFDDTGASGPVMAPVRGGFPAWAEALQLMVPGEKRRFWFPAALAYGDHPKEGLPAGDLVYDVELLEIRRAGEAPTPPPDVAAPPAGALKTKSAISYRVIRPGEGPQPRLEDTVTATWVSWSTAGKMVSKSSPDFGPTPLVVKAVRPELQEALMTMRPGEKARFWVPLQKGALGEATPAGGMIVYDVELVSIP